MRNITSFALVAAAGIALAAAAPFAQAQISISIGARRPVHMATMTMPRTVAVLMVTMGRSISMGECSSALARGSMARTSFMAR